MTTLDALRDAQHIADVLAIPYDEDLNQDRQSDFLERQNDTMKKALSAARIARIDRLLRDLDILIYCELSALYYMDCSFILFALRAIVQLFFFTPKALPFDPTRNKPFVVVIFASNLICMLFHKFVIHPEASEVTRGYLHGGLFIDFIGQKAPVSVLRILLQDLLILLIDIVMLGLIVERVNAKAARENLPATNSTSDSQHANTQQDYDSEERGVLWGESRVSLMTSPAEAIELAELPSRDAAVDDTGPEQTVHLDGFFDDEPGRAANETYSLDPFASGEAVIMDVGLIQLLREQWRYTPASAPRRASYVPSDETAAFLRNRFGIQVSSDGRIVRLEQS